MNKMNSRKAKETLLEKAITHYESNARTFVFISLWNDNEPYPIEDVITLLNERIANLERYLKDYPNSEMALTGLSMTRRNLARMTKRATILKGLTK